jgi:hypothetical protein
MIYDGVILLLTSEQHREYDAISNFVALVSTYALRNFKFHYHIIRHIISADTGVRKNKIQCLMLQSVYNSKRAKFRLLVLFKKKSGFRLYF